MLNVKDFGAIGDGVSHPLSERFPSLELAQMRYPFVTTLTDEIDWAACQSALDYAKTKQITNNYGNSSSLSVGLKINIPLGVYVLNRSVVVNTTGHILINGESAAFISTRLGVKAFDITAHWATIDGVKFSNMDICIKFQNANIDGGFLRLSGCDFIESHSQGIVFSAQSSILTMDKCKFVSFNRPSSNMLKVTTGTTVTLNDCWIEGNCSYMFDISAERFTLNDCSGVPTGDLTWLILRKGSFFANNVRFGGEGNACIVENWANYLSGNMCKISLEQCLIACGDGKISPPITKPIIKLYNIPQSLSIKRSSITSPSTMYGTWVDPTLGAEPLGRLRNMGIDTDAPLMFTGNTEARKVVFPPDYLATIGTTHIKTSDFITNQMVTATGYSSVESFNGCTVDYSVTDDYGNPMVKVTSSADGTTPVEYYDSVDPGTNTRNPNYYYERRFDGALSFEPVSGVHTAVFVINILAGGLHNVKFYAGNAEKVYKLNQGTHVIAFPFYLDTVNDARKRLGIRVSNLFPGSSFQIGKFRAFRGYANVRGLNTVVYGSTKPASAPIACGVWSKGDEVKNINIATGQPQGWVCTVTGGVGTWKASGYIKDVKTGTLTYNGDGTATMKVIPHGLGIVPSFFQVTLSSLDAGTAGIKFVTADATNLTVTFNTAPITGTNNVSLNWKAEV
ncbi:hypothetical protein SOP93_17640 [Peribacillus frigoritolerans]|uniref:hypothetical protein n=1 Tax=Peribacillus frigoritolerans TaxID=450367 RepID=UPI002B254687|nr:hypothetical protein [Peribacillus frigoritolerans]MEB2492980.1 hypothetical protein [Peribacillus frigoritolerans]